MPEVVAPTNLPRMPGDRFRLEFAWRPSWHRWRESLGIAVNAIWSNRLRSVLAIFGVMVGVAVVALVAALLEASQRFIVAQAEELGPGIVRIEKASFQDFSGDVQAFEEAKAKRPDITLEHLKALRARLGDRLEIGARVAATLSVRRGNQSLKSIVIQGVNANIQALSTVKIEHGRALTEFDDQYRREVCVIGADVADALFPIADPIGKTIKLGASPYQIIGVYAPIGSALAASQDAFVHVPLNSFAKLFGTRSHSIALLAKAKIDEPLPEGELAEDGLSDLLQFSMRQVRRLAPDEADNFSFTTAGKINAFAGNLTRLAAAVLFPLTGIALAVAGIVVMNMMLASVTERTREIGIRKALGARRRDILAQFLFESMLLTFGGGLCGLLLAVALGPLLARFIGFAVSVPLWAALAALSVSLIVGVLFGVLPARRAARLDPIEALHSE